MFRFFTIAGYFTSETIMALSDGNITIFFIQKQGTNESQHIYFGGRRKTTLGTQHNITLFTIGKTTSSLYGNLQRDELLVTCTLQCL